MISLLIEEKDSKILCNSRYYIEKSFKNGIYNKIRVEIMNLGTKYKGVGDEFQGLLQPDQDKAVFL